MTGLSGECATCSKRFRPSRFCERLDCVMGPTRVASPTAFGSQGRAHRSTMRLAMPRADTRRTLSALPT